MSFPKKIARKKTGEIIDESKPTLCAPIRISDINYNNIKNIVQGLRKKTEGLEKI